MNPMRNTRRRCTGAAVVLLLCALEAGCGSGIYPVQGKVVWKDGKVAKELEGSHVVFDNTEKKVSARGVVQADGTFQLTMIKTNDGAYPGDYKVMIVEDRKNANAEGTLLMPAMLDTRYADPKTSDLSAKVTSGPNNITLTVDRAKGK